MIRFEDVFITVLRICFVEKCNQSVSMNWKSVKYIESNPSSKNTISSIHCNSVAEWFNTLLQDSNYGVILENTSNYP